MATTILQGLDKIIEKAQERSAKQQEEVHAQLEQQDMAMIATHFGFVTLHMLLCALATKLRRSKYLASVVRTAGTDISISLGPNAATCRCLLDGPNVTIFFFSLGQVRSTRQWMAPPTVDTCLLMSSLEPLVTEIAQHLVGA